jgi:hypothetical protein
MNAKLVAWSVGIAGGLILPGCGSDDSLPDRDDGTTGGENASGGAPARGGANTGAGMPAAAGMQAIGGVPSTGGTPATGGGGAGAGAGGQGISGGNASATAGRGGEGGAGGNAVAGAGGRAGGAGGAGGRGGVAGRTQGGGAGGYAGVGAGGQQAAGTGGTAGLGPEATGGRVSGYGTVMFQVNSRNQMVRLQTTMFVPPKPPPSGTLFLWPGLQPNGANFEPIDNGVLQPVLTWGPSCSPGNQPRAYSTWWISGQYVNTFGNEPGYTDCNGGTIMSVDVGDTLTIHMALAGTDWTQTVTDEQTAEEVTYTIDMRGQAQNIAYFVIEEYSSTPVSEVIFTDTTITFGSADAADCKLTMRGKTDYVSVPVPSTDGLTCSIADIILRAEGIE